MLKWMKNLNYFQIAEVQPQSKIANQCWNFATAPIQIHIPHRRPPLPPDRKYPQANLAQQNQNSQPKLTSGTHTTPNTQNREPSPQNGALAHPRTWIAHAPDAPAHPALPMKWRTRRASKNWRASQDDLLGMLQRIGLLGLLQKIGVLGVLYKMTCFACYIT